MNRTPPPLDQPFSRRRLCASIAAVALLPVASSRSAQAQNPPADFSPEMFGARGDGVTDDTQAFAALSEAVNRAGGGVVTLRRGAVYVAGRQVPAGRFLLNGTAILSARNVATFIVRMNGATLKFRDGMLFGSFDPLTRRPRPANAPNVKPGERADIGYAIRADNVGFFSVSGGVIDGNSRGAVIGGSWGDTGRQCVQYGIASYDCGKVELSNVRIFDSCLDGLTHASRSTDERALVVRAVTVERVGRNCVSLIGCNQALFEDCTFRDSGRAPTSQGPIRAAPASCFDVEAEHGHCRNVVIRSSRLDAGPDGYTAFVADSGPSSDILVEDCDLTGPLWTAKPRTTFERCRIHGRFAKLLGGQADAADNSRIVGCRLTDNPAYPELNVIDLEGAGSGVEISDSSFSVSHGKLNFRGGILRDVIVNFATGTDKIDSRDFAMLLDGARLTNFVINERIPAGRRPAEAFYITDPRSASNAVLNSPSAKLMWRSWSPGAGGHTGRYQPR